LNWRHGFSGYRARSRASGGRGSPFETQKLHSRWERVLKLKDVCFYEFVAVPDNVRVKVIVKEVTGGEKHFWSIIPFLEGAWRNVQAPSP
jgi:hypothetical protein